MKYQYGSMKAVRDVRKMISREFDNDPNRLVEHYLKEQEEYRQRLLLSTSTEQVEGAMKCGSRRSSRG